MEISQLLLFKTINYIDANRHEIFCKCAIGRIEATASYFFTNRANNSDTPCTLAYVRQYRAKVCFWFS